jgi:formate hydrogenlyase subunit 4
LPLAFLADLIGGAFVLALAGFMTSLAGLDTASPYGGLGASRASWIGSMAEPALILVFFTVGVVSASDNPLPDEPRHRRVALRAGTAHSPAGPRC